MNRRTEPLSPEERDLAERLERLGGPREPAPALDAAILAAARAAVAPDAAAPADPDPPAPAATPADPKVTPLRPRSKPAPPRWPLGFGLAASLVLAAGIGWKLQGDGEGSSAEIAEASAPAAMADEAMEAVMIDPPAPPPPPPPLEQDDAAAARRLAQAPAAAAKAAPLASEPVFEAEAAAPAQVFEAAPAGAGPVAADSAEAAPKDDAALDKVTVTGARVPASRNVGAAEYTRTPLSQRREQSMQTSTPPVVSAPAPPPPPPPPAAPPAPERARAAAVAAERDAEARKSAEAVDRFDERPPVSADSPEFRQAWLQRIRERLARGEDQAARDSLQEFRRRYPDVELPEDLRKLAATLPPVP